MRSAPGESDVEVIILDNAGHPRKSIEAWLGFPGLTDVFS